MTSSVAAVAKANQASEILRHQGIGAQIITARNVGRYPVVLATFMRRNGSASHVALATSQDAQKTLADVGFTADGATATFNAAVMPGFNQLNPILPGTFYIPASATSPELYDRLRDGNLYFNDRGARRPGSSGTFAALANEKFYVKVDGGGAQLIQMGTEATIGDAVTKINSQLKGAVAVAAGAQNVHIDSSTISSTSSVEVVSADAGITTKLGISNGISTSLAGKVNYFNGTLSLALPGGYAPSAAGTVGGANAAIVEATVDGPYRLAAGDTLIVNRNGGGDATATFTAASATVSGSGGTFATMANETFNVQVGTGPVQTVTLGTEATLAAAVATINAQLQNASCAALGAQNVSISSDVKGTAGRIRLTNVPAGVTTKLGLANNADVSGTGNVADINAVTVAEVKTILEAALSSLTVTAIDARFQISAATSVQVNATSTAETKFGLTTSLATASTGVGVKKLRANYILGSLLDVGKTKQYRVPQMGRDDTLMIHGAGKFGASLINLVAEQEAPSRLAQ